MAHNTSALSAYAYLWLKNKCSRNMWDNTLQWKILKGKEYWEKVIIYQDNLEGLKYLLRKVSVFLLKTKQNKI